MKHSSSKRQVLVRRATPEVKDEMKRLEDRSFSPALWGQRPLYPRWWDRSKDLGLADSFSLMQGLEFRRRLVTQRRVDPLCLVYIFDKIPNVLIRIGVVLVFVQVYLILFDGANEPLGVTVLPGRSHVRHADLNVGGLQHLYLGCRYISNALFRVMQIRRTAVQSLL